ncbi:glycoside hydrolase family 24 protein [Paraburkholderia terrae]|uniref:Muramidase n=1 Tax=Paraburkholderia terrae TaxID=311230 RepID=A0A2I8EXB4_9BURK|nr:glycoside hydrolase family 104 protein [Paraburkholderia terrae]AUT64247.1 muramidase [Paraburkholderia terrae]
MVSHRNHSTHPAKPAAPATQPPQWQPLNWSFPFAPKNGNPADPRTWLKALASGDGGFYPLGANGMFHGGVHFDVGTGGALTQGKGVQAIADGEVVAYRLDATYPELTYPTTPPRHALYSTGFVLMRHKLVLPPEPETSGTSSTKASPASSASATTASGTQTYQPPADEVLEFYSLYMHQLDWAGYQAVQADAGSSSALSIHPLPFWQGDRHFLVGGKAGDRQVQPPQRNTPFRFDLASAGSNVHALGDGAQLGGVAAGPSPDSLGALAPYADSKVRYALPLADAASAADAPQGVQGVRILDRADGTVIGLLPRGGELNVVGSAVAGWAQIAKILKGSPVAAVAGATPDPRAVTGWVNLDALDVVVDPKPLDTVVVLDKPYPVKAGDVMGYLGEYQNSSHSQVMPPTPKRSLLHVEVFSGAQIESFISKSQDRAKKLPESGRTLLVIQQGAKLVKCPDPQSNAQLAGLKLELAKGDPGKGCWAKVQPTRSGPQSVGRVRGRAPQVSKTPVGSPLWVERQYAGKVAGAVVHTWSDFPLQIASAQGPAVGYQQVLSRAQLEQSTDNGKAVDDQDKGGAQWWSIAAGNADGSTILGWVCEKDHPDTQWQSPWAWPGFDTVDTTSIPLLDLYRRNLFEAKQLLDGEEEEFSVVAATVNAGPLIGKLEKAAKRQGDGNGNVTPADLKNALTVPWLAEAVSHLIVRYESEWGGDMRKWEGLSKLMGDGKYVWQAELERIKRLQWWDAVKAVKGFPAGPEVWHIHPIGLIGNFTGAAGAALTLEEARVRAFLRMIRVGEGTESPIGYERLFGGQSFIKDYSRDFSDHPRILITRTNSKGKTLRSTAAGAYQVMGYNWDDPAFVAYRRQYKISDFTPISQDRYCVILLKYKRRALEDIKKGEIQRAVIDDRSNLEWASLPGNDYGQGGVGMSTVNAKFSEYLNDELSGKSDLAVPIGGLDDLIK